MVRDSIKLKNQFEAGEDRELVADGSADQNPSGGILVHDHLKSASMLEGLFYEDLMQEVGGYCGASEDGYLTTVPGNDKDVIKFHNLAKILHPNHTKDELH